MIKQFLEQSNNIEGVFDKKSLAQALKAWQYVISEARLSPDVILKTYGILMNGHLDNAGQFRKHEVRIGSTYGALCMTVPPKMHVWCQQANMSKSEEQIIEDHVYFERIHPFSDGNGRTGRILLNWQRVKNKYPILIIKNSEKQDYYTWFETT